MVDFSATTPEASSPDARGSGEFVLVGSAPTSALTDVTGFMADVLAQPRFASIPFRLIADHPIDSLQPLPEAVADAAGLSERRDLLQLRRTLPIEVDHPARSTAPALAVRAFRIEVEQGQADDIDGWIRVNNRAFAHHPDQGRETRASLLGQIAEDWFDPAGFLVADDPARPGELSGFCWTKVHPATDRDLELGEIYVIGVDPSHAGEGLGASFTLAGLDHLAGRGLANAMLFVDDDNDPARRLYHRLGFTAHHRRRVYSAAPA